MTSDISSEQRKLLDKIAVTGSLHKLLKGSIKCKREVDRWVENFEISFDTRDKQVFTNFSYLWTMSDKHDKNAPAMGLARDIGELKFLLNKKSLFWTNSWRETLFT